MRIVHVVNVADTGGAQTLIEALGLYRLPGTSVHVVVLGPRGVLSERLAASSDTLTHLDIPTSTWRLDRLLRSLGDALTVLEPDIVHSHLLQCDLAVALLTFRRGFPASVSTIHSTGMTRSDRLRSRVLGRAMAVLSRRFASSIACSSQAARYMAQTHYPVRRSLVIDNGVMPPSPPPRARTRGTSITSLSRWHPMKDHENLFRAFADVLVSHPGLVLRCAGSGMTPTNQDLLTLLDDMQLRESVQLLGPVERPGDLLELSDALVISSSYGEALPMAGLEALARGTPVVTTDVGDCKRLCPEAGLLVPARDWQALSRSIRSVLDLGDGEYSMLSSSCRNVAETDFDIRHTVMSYHGVYTRSVGQSRPRVR